MSIKSFGIIGAGLLGITFVITIHEMGHYLAARSFGINTPEFSIGFGPALIKKQGDGTLFVLRALPMGGYVEIAGAGEQWNAKLTPLFAQSQNHFAYRPLYQKILVILAGILVNLLFGIGCLLFLKKPHPTISPNHSKLLGPIGIINLLGNSAFYGLGNYVWFLAFLSLNVALFNLLPLPFFDGGKLLLYTTEHLYGGSLPNSAYIILMIVSFFVTTKIFLNFSNRYTTKT